MIFLRDLMTRFGTFMALLVMCLALSILTWSPQDSFDEATADVLGTQLATSLKAGDHVLVVAIDAEEDRRFAAALERSLKSAGMQAGQVVGEPSDVRVAIQQLHEAGQSLAAVAGSAKTIDKWLIFDKRADGSITLSSKLFPYFPDVPVRKPPRYYWPTFLKRDNLLNVANQIAVIAIIAVGMTMVIIAGGIDLSVGSLIALSSVVAGFTIRANGGMEASDFMLILGSLLGIVACGAIGAFSGTMVIAVDIPPFIVTLAMMLVARGSAFLLANGNSIPDVPRRYTWLGRDADLLGIPNAVVLMVITYAVAHLLLSKTVLGRHIYAVGDNRQAAWLSGISVRRVLLFTYLASSILAGVGGIVIGSEQQSGDPRYGEMYELYVIAAVVVGGTSLSGGRGSVIGTLIGAFIIGVINNGMNLLKVYSHAQPVILGFVILAAVLLDRLKRPPSR